MTTKETLIRQTMAATPDGQAIVRTEHITVLIDWAGKRPKQSTDYRMDGHWVLSEETFAEIPQVSDARKQMEEEQCPTSRSS